MKHFYTMFLTIGSFALLHAQNNVGIGTNTPDAAAKLDISSTNMGLLIPRVALSNVSVWGLAAGSGTNGMLVYNTNAAITGGSGTGFYYWNGIWTKVVAGTTASLSNGKIWVGDASNAPAEQTLSGDVTINNTGVATIQDNAVDGTDISITSESNGSLMYFNGTDWVNLAPGTSGQILRTNGAGAPTWVNATTVIKAQNGVNIATAAPNASATDPYVELGGTLVRSTTITQGNNAFTIGNNGTSNTIINLSSTGDFDVQDNGTSALFVRDDGNVGVGTNAPASKLNVNGDVFIPTGQSYWIGNNTDAGTRLRLHQSGSNGYVDFNPGVLYFRANTTPVVVLENDGDLFNTGSVIAGDGIVNGDMETIQGPGTGTDNNWHTVQLSAGFGASGMSAYSTGSYLDGDIKIQGIDISNLLSGTSGWYSSNGNSWGANATTQNANSGTTCDNCTHQVYCPDGYIATGWQAYAASQLDTYLKLRCTQLNSGFTTVESGAGVESLQNFPNANADNFTHSGTCPTGTFVKGLSIYAASYLDNQFRVYCTGIRRTAW